MTKFSNISIRARTIAIFLALTFGIFGFGTFSIWEMNRINFEAENLGSNWVPSIVAITKLSQSVDSYRNIEAAHILARTDAEFEAEDKTLNDRIGTITELDAIYRQVLTPGYETNKYEEYKEKLDKYLQLSKNRMIPLSRQMKKEEATALFRGDGRKLFRDMRILVDDLVKFNVNGGAESTLAIKATYGMAINGTITAMIAITAASVLASLLFVKTVSVPIRVLTGRMERLASHDLSVEVSGTGRGDEIGAMARAVQVFKDGIAEADRLSAQQAAEQAAKQRRAELIERLVRDFEASSTKALEAVTSAASQLDRTAHGMTRMADMTSSQATAVASAATETSANVQTVATATEEMTSSIREIGSQISRSAGIAGRAVAEAANTTGAVRSLAEAAQRIGDVVGLITNIASQTNLLALNATIEAARAGEAGKGFAVVAGEVKSLAGQTARATDEIATQIAAIQQTTQGVVEAIAGIGGTIANINDITTAITAAIEEQGAATNEISRNVQQAAIGTHDVSMNIEKVTLSAGEAGSAANQVLGAAGELNLQARSMRNDMEQFLSRIRSA